MSNKNHSALQSVDGRIRSLQINDKTNIREIAYWESVRTDLVSKMSTEEIETYTNSSIKIQTAEEAKVERNRIVAAMAENKDRPSH